MLDFSVLLEKMMIFLIIMVIGYFLARRGMLDKNTTRVISSLTLNVFMCATILGSALGLDTAISLAEMGRFLLALFGMQLLGYIVGALVTRILPIDRKRAPIFELLISMGNTMFIALPIVDALYGARGAFYTALSCLPFNVLLYTYGVYRLQSGLDKRSFRLRDVFSMPLCTTLVSLLLVLTRLSVPGPLRALISAMSGATMPLSMLVIGASLSSVSLLDAFRNGWLYAAAFMRLLLIPLLTWLLLGLFVSDPVLLMTAVIIAACPSAIIVTVMALQYKLDEVFAAEGALQTTALSMLTIPLIIWLLGGGL